MGVRWIVVAGLLLALAPAGASAEFPERNAPQCGDYVPEAVAPPSAAPIDVSVMVLLDGVSAERGREVMTAAAMAYTPLGVRLVAHFESVAFTPTNERQLIAEAKSLLGGRRPEFAHAVYVLTAKDITSEVAGGEDPGVAGWAACIGGIAFPNMAFAVGEDRQALVDTDGAKIAAHELGHLLGAHHHYGSCAEGLLHSGSATEPCTVMSSLGPRFLTLHFSTPSAAVVRGYAEKFALPLPPRPPPPGSAPPAATQGPPQPRPGTTPMSVSVHPALGSARRANAKRSFSLRLRSETPVRDLRVRLVRGGRTAAEGRLHQVDGAATLRMRARRRLRAGKYELHLSGRTADGRATARLSASFRR